MPKAHEKMGLVAEAALHNSSSSSEFMKLYSPMADKMAETARRSSNGAAPLLEPPLAV